MLSKKQKTHDKTLTLCSYNVKKYDISKYHTIKTLFEMSTFLLIQETWLAETEFLRTFKNHFPNSECISTNRMDTHGRKAGRPYGGIGICYRSNVKCKIENVITVSKSLCALKIYNGELCILLINVYMPCSDNTDSLEEYTDILQEISRLCINNSTQHIIIGGDWNADLSRNDGRTKLFKEFIAQENLFNPLDMGLSNVPFTFSGPMINGVPPNTSTIDHFLVTPNFASQIVNYKTHPLHNNISDHDPLILRLNIDVEYHRTYERTFTPSVQWHKCNGNNINYFKDTLDNGLLKLNPSHEALRCRGYKCTKHYIFIQEIHDSIISNISIASNDSLPHTSKTNEQKIIPGWNEHVKIHSDRSKLWHEIWVQSGRPRDGHIANIRRKTRLQYHYAIRHVVKENTRMRNNKLAEAVSENNDRVLWDEVRKMSKTNNELPTTMDEHSSVEKINDIFADKYNILYNTVSYNTHDLNSLAADIDARIDNGCPNNANLSDHSHSITVQEVKDAICKLKQGKKEENGLYSNHFKYGTERLYVMITLLFNCILTHGIAPDDLLLGTMIPLIKNSRGNKQCSDNYRSLTIGTGLAKILDLVILNQQAEKLKTSDLQFGFKEKSSTTMCTFMAQETIEYYTNKGSNVHALLLDASKAFDRVDYIKLFNKLLDRGMCPLTVRLLLNMYTKQKLQVKWNNSISSKFGVTNGVRQGGVLSPLLFTVYIDELLEKLKRKGIGCHLGLHFVGALGYADDIILLCPSVAGLKIMIKICEEYAKEHSIKFNGNKSKYLVFGDYKYNPTIKVNNEIVDRCESAEHLGHLLHTGNTSKECIEFSIKQFKKLFYGFLSRFDSCYLTAKNKLFHQYCSSMYGSQLLDMTNPTMEKVYTQWRKAHRQVLEMPNMTHCDLLPLIADNMPLECILDCKYISFYKSIVKSENKIVSYTAKHRLYDHTSTLGRNVTHLMHKYGTVVDDVLSLSKDSVKKLFYNRWLDGINVEYPMYAEIIKDMVIMREGRCTRVFSNEDCKFIINFCCVI